jgi:hypothetical protein
VLRLRTGHLEHSLYVIRTFHFALRPFTPPYPFIESSLVSTYVYVVVVVYLIVFVLLLAPSKMREVISVHVGQAGVQIGNACCEFSPQSSSSFLCNHKCGFERRVVVQFDRFLCRVAASVC